MAKNELGSEVSKILHWADDEGVMVT